MHCDLSELSSKDLVTLYQNVTGKEVKKFESRRAAVKRVGKAVAEKYDATVNAQGFIYAPPGMTFDPKSLSFVNRGGSVELATLDNDAVDEEQAEVEPAERPTSVDSVEIAADRMVKTSGTPVRGEGGSPAKGRRLGIGKRMEQMLAQDVLPKEIVARIHEEFPASRATTKDVYLIRSRMNEEA